MTSYSTSFLVNFDINELLSMKANSYAIPRTIQPILFTFEKFSPIFLKIKLQGPSVRDMPRHKLEVIKLLLIAIELVKTII